MRKFILGSVAVLLAAGLTGCSGGAEDNAATDDVVADDATPAMDAPEAADSLPAANTTGGDQTCIAYAGGGGAQAGQILARGAE